MRLLALCIAALSTIRAGAEDAPARIAVERDDPTRVVVSCDFPDDAQPIVDEATGRRFLTLVLVDATTGEPGPPIFGAYAVVEGRLTFRPRFGLARGATYRALAAGRGEAEYRVPAADVAEPTVVEAIYPSGDRLPANLLKFYVVFSRPMREGREVLDRVKLVDSRGVEIGSPWRDVELWNRDATRLTLFIHPGRIKQGVNLREQLGPVLRPDAKYELVVGADLRDARGVPLGREYRKSFATSPEVYAKIDVAAWRLTVPPAASRRPLVVRFAAPLDQFLAVRCLHVRDSAGGEIAGSAAIDDEERRWTFTPTAAWRDDRYVLEVDDVLEDQAGNSPVRVFDTDLSKATNDASPPVLRRVFNPDSGR